MRTRIGGPLRYSWTLVLCVVAFAGAGCGGGNDSSFTQAPSLSSLSGTVQGGTAAIAGAKVTLYQAGTSGKGANAKVLATATTNAAGKFALKFSKPHKDALLYLTAIGGNAGPAKNSAIGLLVIAGTSSALASPITLNELTTVAGEFALAQFVDGTGQIVGTSSTNLVGLANAASLAETNLVDIASGTLAGFWPDSSLCSGATPPDNCEGLERLNSLANILAGCIQSNGPLSAKCSSLFSHAPGSTTLQSVHAIATNPGRNADGLFADSQVMQPYLPALTTAPEAWTLALKYVGNGAEFDGPGNLAFDKDGNVWISNNYVFNSDPTVPACGSNIVSVLTPIGVDFPGAPFTGGGLDGGGFGVVVDLNANIWVGNFGFSGQGCATPPPGNSVSQFAPTGTVLSPAAGFTQGAIAGPQGIAIDQSNNLWIANFNSTTVTKFPKVDPTAAVNFPSLGLQAPFGVAVDSTGRVWIGGSGNNSIAAVTGDGSPIAGSPFAGGGINKPLGVAIDSLDNVWIANSLGDSVTMLDSSGNPSPSTPFTGGGLVKPWGIAVDGNDNVWVADFTGVNPRLSELCGAKPANCPSGLHTGEPISPTSGYTSNLLQRLTAVQIDSSGNAWVTDNWRPVPPPTNPGGSGMVEFVGIAAPVKIPMLGPPQQP